MYTYVCIYVCMYVYIYIYIYIYVGGHATQYSRDLSKLCTQYVFRFLMYVLYLEDLSKF